MKKLFFAAAALLLSVSVNAQHNKEMKNLSPDERAEKVVQQMSDEVEINDDEKQQLVAIHVEYFTQKQQMREDGNEDKEQHKQMREEKNAAVQNILGDDRSAQLKESRGERNDNFKERRKQKDDRMKKHHHKHQDADQPRKK